MTALTTDRRTPERVAALREFPLAAATTLYAGAMAALNAANELVPMSASTTLRAVGRCEARADNSAGASGDVSGRVKIGCFRFANSAAADEITTADIGSTCYGVDDQTVAKTDGTGTRSAAGTIFDVDANGVWVEFT
ncbi:hypothetical protein [Labrenzia sp. PHM005]|uniref:hypothetical protein n=1 Tax=Labrenzia sp. PHM005 TaxID=2590016 RepID=UPI00113FCAA4|nr:hypothetical protein [Labrenzia sp. PHM005]QDG74448.1 hypothetical protein FJ695_00360 [Labrenzia sp. PHM005]